MYHMHLCNSNNVHGTGRPAYMIWLARRGYMYIYANSVGMGINRFGFFLWRRRPFESCSAIEQSIFHITHIITSQRYMCLTENSQFLRGEPEGVVRIYRRLSIDPYLGNALTVLRTVHVCDANNSNTPSDSTRQTPHSLPTYTLRRNTPARQPSAAE